MKNNKIYILSIVNLIITVAMIATSRLSDRMSNDMFNNLMIIYEIGYFCVAIIAIIIVYISRRK